MPPAKLALSALALLALIAVSLPAAAQLQQDAASDTSLSQLPPSDGPPPGTASPVVAIVAVPDNVAPVEDSTSSVLEALEAFHWSGYIQAQWEAHSESENRLNGTNLLNLDRFSIRRGRLKLRYDGIEHARFVLEFDANSTSMSAKEVTASLIEPWTGWDFELAVGLFKTPFGYETLVSHSDLYFPEASALSRTLFPGERDVGLRLTGKSDIFRVALALVNGQPIGGAFPGTDPNEYKDLVGRLGLATPLLDIGVSGYIGTEFQPGAAAIAGSTTWFDANGDAVVDPGEVTTIDPQAAVDSENATRWRLGFDAQLHADIPDLGKFEILAELAYAHRAETDRAGEGRLLAGYVAVVQHYKDKAGIGFRAQWIDPNLGDAGVDDRRTVLSPLLLLYPVPAVRVSFSYDIALEQPGAAVSNDTFTARMQVKF